MKKILFPIMLLLSFQVCSGVSLNEVGDIEYLGRITEAKNSKAFSLYETAPRKPERIIISSPGGAVDYGIQLGEWIVNNQLAVEVGEYCISSCANYVFLAGNGKILRKNSLLGWHGGLLQRSELPFTDKRYLNDVSRLTQRCDFDRFKERYKGKLYFPFSHAHKRECLLMQSMGVDYQIMIAGQYVKHYLNSSGMGFWSYELDALTALGVTDLILKDGTWQPPKSIHGEEVYYMSTEDLSSMNTDRSNCSPIDRFC